MSSSRGEGCGREARGVRGARGVRTHPTSIAQLVQVVHLTRIQICQNTAPAKKVAYRFRHLWKWSLLQRILARHNTWVDRVSVAQLDILVCPQKVQLTVHIWRSIEGWRLRVGKLPGGHACNLDRRRQDRFHILLRQQWGSFLVSLEGAQRWFRQETRMVTWIVPPSVLRKIGFTLAWPSTCTSSASVHDEC